MFRLLKRRRAEVQHQWIVCLPEFTDDVGAFYSAIEETIRERRLPPMQILRIPWREGGLFSAGREYMRIMRERLVFDVGCGAFGSYWFYSCRCATVLRGLTLLHVIISLLTLGSFLAIYVLAFGWSLGWLVLGATIAAFCAILIAAGKWSGLDETLIHMPVVGVIYEALFRRETYYRQDMRAMWQTTINTIVRERVREFAKARGVSDVHFQDVHDIQQPMGITSLAATLGREFAAGLLPLTGLAAAPQSGGSHSGHK